jgi:exopolyphosphatase/guanosine-5'-triphosphate,3'-diphosphate pyrophosphatase
MPRQSAPQVLAVVDMGSNSFRLEVGRVEGDQIFRLDTQRETLRIGAAIDQRGNLTADARRAALACLARFGERLAGLHPSAVRAVATNAFRVAKNAAPFLAQAQRALGFPIDVITGYEEARLIYLGVAHVLPPASKPRLVIDIGGGSTEFIIGQGLDPAKLESLKIGCVGMTQRFFADGSLTGDAFDSAETAARSEIEAIARDFSPAHWRDAYASSGTALALAEILEQNGFSAGGITPEGLARLRRRLIAAGDIKRVRLTALKDERAPVLAGGFAIMAAALDELAVRRINPVGGALRLGVLYDLLGRTVHRDARDATVEQFVERYRIDRAHADRVAAMAVALFRSAMRDPDAGAQQRLHWAARLHETGFGVSHIGFHKHGAYILQHADMPGFSANEQRELSWLVLGCRGSLDKMTAALSDRTFRAQLAALRLAVLLHHARRPIETLRLSLAVGETIRFAAPARWLRAHPLTEHLLAREAREWTEQGYRWKGPIRDPARSRLSA